jgi:hypothetical protein
MTMNTARLPFVLSSALVALGLLGGVAFDERPARPATVRAGFRVVEADFHAHTSFSDGALTPFGVVRQAERRGLDVVAVTEHNTTLPGKMARAYSRLTGGPLVMVGEEITTARYHVIAVGLERTVDPAPLDDVLDDIHAQGALAIAAHPAKRFWPVLVPARERFDGSEVLHPVALRQSDARRASGFRWIDMIAFHEDAESPLAAIGSSDYHWGSVLGICRTLLFVREPLDEAAVIDALRERRTVVMTPSGKTFGRPDLVRALEHEPYAPRPNDYAYRGAGSLDRSLRALGLAGVLGIAFLRGRRRRPR